LMPTGWMIKEQYKNYLQNRNSQKWKIYS
jgi:hypothetical protein